MSGVGAIYSVNERWAVSALSQPGVDDITDEFFRVDGMAKL
jgi:hypothetical protein